MNVIEVNNCSFRYPSSDEWVISELSFSVEVGEVVRVAGRNGAGKSTLLRLCAGHYTPDKGSITYPDGTTPAYMHQNADELLSLEMTIQEHLAIDSVSGVSNNVDSLKMLSSFGLDLEDRMDEFVGYLSGGQRQIIALLCILLHGSKLICLDEYMSALDDKSTVVANKLLNKFIRNSGLSCLVVSHNDIGIEVDREILL